jgi:hypothetical protein
MFYTEKAALKKIKNEQATSAKILAGLENLLSEEVGISLLSGEKQILNEKQKRYIRKHIIDLKDEDEDDDELLTNQQIPLATLSNEPATLVEFPNEQTALTMLLSKGVNLIGDKEQPLNEEQKTWFTENLDEIKKGNDGELPTRVLFMTFIDDTLVINKNHYMDNDGTIRLKWECYNYDKLPIHYYELEEKIQWMKENKKFSTMPKHLKDDSILVTHTYIKYYSHHDIVEALRKGRRELARKRSQQEKNSLKQLTSTEIKCQEEKEIIEKEHSEKLAEKKQKLAEKRQRQALLKKQRQALSNRKKGKRRRKVLKKQ